MDASRFTPRGVELVKARETVYNGQWKVGLIPAGFHYPCCKSLLLKFQFMLDTPDRAIWECISSYM